MAFAVGAVAHALATSEHRLLLDQSLRNVHWPLTLRTLTLGASFNQPSQDILFPATLAELHLGEKFNLMVDSVRWPPNLRALCFGREFDQSLHAANLTQNLYVGTPLSTRSPVRPAA